MHSEHRYTGFYLNGRPAVHAGVVNNTSVGNGADVTEDTLQSTTLTGGTLINTGDRIRGRAYFKFANNANNKTFKLYFGASVIATSGTLSLANSRYIVDFEIVQRSGASQSFYSSAVGNGAGATWDNTILGGLLDGIATENIGSDIVIKTTGQSGTATANNIVSMLLAWELIPNA